MTLTPTNSTLGTILTRWLFSSKRAIASSHKPAKMVLITPTVKLQIPLDFLCSRNCRQILPRLLNKSTLSSIEYALMSNTRFRHFPNHRLMITLVTFLTSSSHQSTTFHRILSNSSSNNSPLLLHIFTPSQRFHFLRQRSGMLQFFTTPLRLLQCLRRLIPLSMKSIFLLRTHN